MKGKNILIGLFIITTIVAVVIAVYFKMDGNNQVEKLEGKLADANSTIKQMEEEQEENKKFVNPDLDLSKCLNVDNDKVKFENGGRVNYYDLMSAYIEEDRKSVVISYKLDKINELYAISNTNVEETEIKIDDFDKKISNIYILEAGQDAGNETVYFLMEDGSVEFLPLRYAFRNNEFKSFGKIKGVSEVAYITGAEAGELPEGSGWITAIAVKEDGSFYDLPTILEEETEYYKYEE